MAKQESSPFLTNQSTEKALAILELLAAAKEPMRLSSISEQLGLNASTSVRFLNARIETFTAPSAEARLANYLLSLPATQGEVTLPVSCRALSEMLNVGRASLYRAFDTLEEQGLTVRQGKTVLIKDADAMRNAFFA